jgi:outer membrane protein insertion porin family
MPAIRLTPGTAFERETLAADTERIRNILREKDYLVPTMNEPRVVYDSETNRIGITLSGDAGPVVEVVIDAEGKKVGSSTQARLLPLKREGTLDYAAIIEGERRLENYFQEQGYFFADVISKCSVDPPLTDDDASAIPNDTEVLCSYLNNSELADRTVRVRYEVLLDRRLKLVDVRIHGVEDILADGKVPGIATFTYDDISSVLGTKRANILGIIPLFGYGRGYTSDRILAEDAATIRSLLRELGYREAVVQVIRGVSPDGENLIITFRVEPGSQTLISEVVITGNTAIDTATLMAQFPDMNGAPYSYARIRNGLRRLAEYYSEQGFYEASVIYSIDDLTQDPERKVPRFRLVYQIQNEGRRFVIDRILVTGAERTKESAVMRALTIKPGTYLKAGDIYTSEQNLFSSDVFDRIDFVPQPKGDNPDGSRSVDVIVDLSEQKPRIVSWGGGYSTDLGWSGFADIRHLNLFGNLWQGGARIRWSQRQQLVQLDYVNPRFIRDGKLRFSPLTISAQYQRDSTVTRFFRSAFDRGTFGIVQRVDEDGNPIDEFGAPAGSPTLNRFTLSAESNQTLSVKNRSILFVRYRFEDVRLFNIDSLLVKDLLIPDSRIRISGFGATFVRDTRKNCALRYTVLQIIASGEPGSACRYNASDPTGGDYFTAEYNFSHPLLGANIGFNKVQISYNRYYRVPRSKGTVIAARGLFGLANVFNGGDRFVSAGFPDLDGVLPISERFFAGGSNTLRGFQFESAGPRVVVVPTGTFRDRNGKEITLDPFTIPFGGNALAVVNIEGRIPLTKTLRAVPFYDGGNVFLRVKDMFRRQPVDPSNVAAQNLQVTWSNTIGLGIRLKTPVGGEFGIDYGYLLNPPTFIIPQPIGPPTSQRLRQGQLHFRFAQAF